MNKKLSAADEIIQHIADKIISNKYRPNDKLPNERDLAEQYNVSRGRIREALRGLATAGLIEIRTNQGSFVTSHSSRLKTQAMSWLLHPPHTTFTELYEVREVLERAMYIKAFEQCSQLDLNAIEEALEQLLSTDSSDISKYADTLESFDRSIAKVTKNPLFINLIEALIVLRRETVERLLALGGSAERSKALRTEIVKAFKNQDKEKVISAVDKFFSESIKPLADLES